MGATFIIFGNTEIFRNKENIKFVSIFFGKIHRFSKNILTGNTKFETKNVY